MKLDENHKRFNKLLDLLESNGGLTDVELIQRGIENAGNDAKHLAKLGILKLKEPQGIWKFSDYGNKLNLKKGKLSYWEYHHKLETRSKRWNRAKDIIVVAAIIFSGASLTISIYTNLIKPKQEKKETIEESKKLIGDSAQNVRHYVDSSLNARFDTSDKFERR